MKMSDFKPIDMGKVPKVVTDSADESDFKIGIRNAADDKGPLEIHLLEEIGQDWLGEGFSPKATVEF